MNFSTRRKALSYLAFYHFIKSTYLLERGKMIHTATLRIKITESAYWSMDRVIGIQSYQKNKTYIKKTEYLSEFGLVLYGKKISLPGNRMYYCADLFINPAKLLGREQVTDIYSASAFTEFEQAFNSRIKDYGLECLPDLEDWKAHRIDYTYNAKTRYVSQYIKLLQKSDLRGYRLHLDNNNNRSMKPGSLYILNKSITLNFYDKADQLQNEGRLQEEIEQATNIMRLEVQCHSRKLNGIKKKYDLESKSAIEFIRDQDMGADILRYYTGKITWNLPYMKKESAIAIIQKSRFKDQTKKDMIAIIKDTARQYSRVDKVRIENKKYSGKKMYKDQFKKLNINPVTINKNAKGVSCGLESISLLLENAIAEEQKEVPQKATE